MSERTEVMDFEEKKDKDSKIDLDSYPCLKMIDSRYFSAYNNNSQRRILIVDDEPYNILALRIMLKQLCPVNYQSKLDSVIDQAPNGRDALEMSKNINYGLIFMDCQMPIMNGFEASIGIRKYFSQEATAEQPKIIALTGHVDQDYIQNAFSCGMDEVISKPANIEVLKCLFAESIEII